MGDVEIKALLQELCKPVLKKNVYLNISGISMSATTLHTLSTKFTPKSCLSGLELTISYIADVQLAMKYLIEGYTRSHCKYLGLEGCCSEIIHHLILFLTCPYPKTLHIYLSHFLGRSEAMCLFSEALKYSRILELSLAECSIGDKSLDLLAAAVCHKDCQLVVLHIERNR